MKINFKKRSRMKQDQIGTVVGSTVHLTGALRDSSEIIIYGSVEGEVNSESKITIEETAVVKGPITAPVVIVSGFVKGAIIAKEKLELNPPGKIQGNVETADLLIHSGAFFLGKCVMPEREGMSVPPAEEAPAEKSEEPEESKEEEAEEEN